MTGPSEGDTERPTEASAGSVNTFTSGEDGGGRIVARNALFLLISQVITALISFAVTALLARHLGAVNYGVFYLAFSFVQSAFILVELGQDYYVVRAVARERELSGAFLGTGFVLRIAAAMAVYFPLMGAARLLGYPEATQAAISLMVLFHFVSSLANGFSVVIRGAERMDYEATSRVAFRTFIAAATVITIFLDGSLLAIIRAQALGAAVALPVFALVLSRLGVPRPRVSVRSAKMILAGGAPFLFYGIVTTSHASVDAIMLSKLAPGEVVGWYGAAMRFAGLLVFPATILASALFPTLSRLFMARPRDYREIARSGLRVMLVLGALVGAGTYLFADEAVTIVFGEEAFSATATILKILSPYFVLVFVNIILGTAVMAANRQTAWASSKGFCLLLVVILNAILIPLCQERFGNGGIGSAVAMLLTEVVMLAAAFLLIPRGTLVAPLWRDLGRVAGAVAGMIGAAWLLRGMTPVIGMAAAGSAYIVVLFLLGAISKEELNLLRDVLRKRVTGSAAKSRY